MRLPCIDTETYAPHPDPACLTTYGIDAARPYVLFVGRMTRQKGLRHLLDAVPYLVPDAQVVLCAGAADTPDMAREFEEAVARLQQHRTGVIWIPAMVPRQTTIVLYSHAAVFCCPSIYEPFGLINLEAMACETPVVASAVGGIPEIVEPGDTGLLVPIESVSATNVEPRDPDRFARDLAAAVNELLDHPDRRAAMAAKARARVEQQFSWTSIAR